MSAVPQFTVLHLYLSREWGRAAERHFFRAWVPFIRRLYCAGAGTSSPYFWGCFWDGLMPMPIAFLISIVNVGNGGWLAWWILETGFWRNYRYSVFVCWLEYLGDFLTCRNGVWECRGPRPVPVVTASEVWFPNSPVPSHRSGGLLAAAWCQLQDGREWTVLTPDRMQSRDPLGIQKDFKKMHCAYLLIKVHEMSVCMAEFGLRLTFPII